MDGTFRLAAGRPPQHVVSREVLSHPQLQARFRHLQERQAEQPIGEA